MIGLSKEIETVKATLKKYALPLVGFKIIKVCIEYKDNKPVYKEYEGWVESIAGIQDYNDLPSNAKKYIKDIEEFLNVPIDIISNGPGREENIVIKNIF